MLSKPKKSASSSLLLALTGLKWSPLTSWSNIETVSHKTCPQAEQTRCWRIRTVWISASSSPSPSRCGRLQAPPRRWRRHSGRGLKPALIRLRALHPAAIRLSPAGDDTRDQSRPQVRLGRFTVGYSWMRVLKKNQKQIYIHRFNSRLHLLEQVWSGIKTLRYSDANHPGMSGEL